MRARDSPRCLCNQRAQEDGSTERESAARRSQPTPAGRRGRYIQYIVGGRACQRARRGTPRPWPQLAAATADPRRRPWRRPPRQGGELGVAGRGSGAAAYPPPASPRDDCPTARCHPPPPGRRPHRSRSHTQQPPPYPAAAPTPSRRPRHREPPRRHPAAAAPAGHLPPLVRAAGGAPARPSARLLPRSWLGEARLCLSFFCSSRRRLLTVRTRTGPLACPTPAGTPHRKRRRGEGQGGGGGSLLAVPRRPSDGRTLRRRRDVRPPRWSERAPPPTGTGDPLAAVAGSRRASFERGCGRHYRSSPAQSSPHHPPLLMPPL